MAVVATAAALVAEKRSNSEEEKNCTKKIQHLVNILIAARKINQRLKTDLDTNKQKANKNRE